MPTLAVVPGATTRTEGGGRGVSASDPLGDATADLYRWQVLGTTLCDRAAPGLHSEVGGRDVAERTSAAKPGNGRQGKCRIAIAEMVKVDADITQEGSPIALDDDVDMRRRAEQL